MGFLNRLKDKLAPAKGKASDLAHQHGDKIDLGLDKAAQLVDRRTKGRYSDKIRTGTGKAKDALDRFAGEDDGRKEGDGHKDVGGRTPPGDTPPPSPPSSPTPPAAS
ncbi:antitoxin [Streptomyces aureocirculatus]|uniref:antitoxin n=1 Tax=Streptomyces aureocirculatus TaxID=67275 RepID=UPI0004C923E1|nr:antitoxin [Streptomyces aureocirculatus]